MDSAGFKFRSPFISADRVQPLWLAFTSLNSWKHTTARRQMCSAIIPPI